MAGFQQSADYRKAKLDAQLPVAGGPVSPWYIGLYSNNFDPDAGVVFGDLTECTFPGYARQTYLYIGSATDDGERATKAAPGVLFTRTAGGSPENVYGYFLLTNSGGFMGAERFAGAPQVVSAIGDTVGVVPTQQEANEVL